MEDRFKFRCYNKILRKMFDVKCMSYINGIVKRIEVQDGERILIFNEWKNNIDNTVLVQCTGLKDKNGKLIYEGDILKGKKDMLCSPHSSRMVDRVGVVEIPQNMFVARCRDVKNNCTLFCQFDWVKTEVIGNIYENKELLESEE